MNVSSGQISSGVTLTNDSMYVYSGGEACAATVGKYGYIYVLFGGTANNTTVNSYGRIYVSGGGTASNTTVNSYGSLCVSSGGTANSIAVYNYGFLYIYSGGSASGITLNPSARITVSRGGTISDVTVNQYGSLYISSAVAANRITVNSSGVLLIYSGGTASDVTLNSYGRITVSRGGTINRATINSYGYLFVSSGVVANSIAVNSYGSLYISSGGTATGLSVVAGGRLYLTVAPRTYVQGVYGGSAFEIKDAKIADFSISSSVYLYVLSGGTATGITVNSSGVLSVYSGASALNINWTPCEGNVSAADGATVTYASNYTGVYFGSGNKLLSATTVMTNKVVSGVYGSMYVFDGGVADSPIVRNSGRIYVFSGGTATNATVSRGYMYISNGGSAVNASISSGGLFYVYSGASAVSAVINSGGYMYVGSGASAAAIRETGGYVGTAVGANVFFVANTFSGLVLSNASATLHSGTTATGVGIRTSGYLNVYSSGVANDITVSSGGSLNISSGGAVTSAAVNSGGRLNVFADGSAVSATVNIGGQMSVGRGASAIAIKEAGGYVLVADGADAVFVANTFSGLVLSSGNSATLHSGTTATDALIRTGGYLNIYDGGVANDITVSAGGMVNISGGGSASGITVNSSAVLSVYAGASALNINWTPGEGSVYAAVGATVTYANSYTGVYLRSGSSPLSSAMTISGASGSGSMYVFDGGSAVDTFIDFGGEINIFSGGRAIRTVLGDSNYSWNTIENIETVQDGGIAEGTVVFDGVQSVGGSAVSTLLSYTYFEDYMYGGWYESRLGTQTVADGGVAESAMIYGGEQTVYSGGTAVRAQLSYGDQNVYNGGSVTDTVLTGGYQKLYSGAVASGNIIRGGWHYVYAGGSAVKETISGGVQYVSGGAADVDISGGTVYVYATGNLQNAQLRGGACLSVNGGSAVGIVQDQGGRLNIAFSSSILVSGQNEFSDFRLQDNVASGFVFYNGVTQNITSGGTMLNAVAFSGVVVNVKSAGMFSGGIIASDARLYVSRGGSANGVTVNAEGCIIVAEGAARGVRILQGGNAVADFNGVIEGTSDGVAFAVSATNRTQDFVVLPGYTQIVDSGKTALHTEILSSGQQNVTSGGYVGSTIIRGGGQSVTAGGSAQNTEIRSGSQYVNMGAAVSETMIYGGYQYAYSGADIGHTVIYGGSQIIASGGSAPNTSIYGGGQILYGFAVASDTVICGGSQLVSANAQVHNAVLIGGTQIVGDNYGYYYGSSSVASALNTHISQGGVQQVLNCGLADGTVLSSGGTLSLAYGSAANIQHLYGGVLSVDLSEYYSYEYYDPYYYEPTSSSYSYLTGTNEKGAFSVVSGSAENLILYDRAELYVSYGMTANSTTVSSGGILRVVDGGSVTGTSVGNGGCAMVVGATAEFVSGNIASGGMLYVSGNSIGGVVLEDGAEICLDLGGIVSGVSNGEDFYSSCGNTTLDFIIHSGYVQRLTSGATASRSVIESGGTMVISNGATAADIVQQSGGIISAYLQKTPASRSIWGSHESGYFYFSNGTAVNFLLNRNGYLSLDSGTVLTSSIINGGQVYVNSATAENISVNGGYMTIGNYYGSGSILRNAVIGTGGSAYIYKNNRIGGDILVKGVLQIGGAVSAESGTDITISITSGHSSNSAYITGFSNISDAAFSIDVANSLNGRYLLATNVDTAPTGMAFSVAGVSRGDILLDESVFYNSSRYTLSQSGTSLYLEVLSDIAVESVKLISGESVTYCGPIAENRHIVVGELLAVYTNGIVRNTAVEFGGSMHISAGGYAERIEVLNGGGMALDSGAQAVGVTVSSGGILEAASAVTISELRIGGSAFVASGGIVSQADVLAGGGLSLGSGAMLSGTITVAGRISAVGTVNAHGAAIRLDLSEAGNSPLANDLSLLEGAFVTIHAENGQTGVYRLSDTLSGAIGGIGLEGTSLSLTSENFSYDGNYRYLLSESGDGLSLEIKRVDADFAVSELTVPGNFIAGENAVFSWTLANHGELPISGVRQSLYIVDADDPERRTLLKSVYLTDLPGYGASSTQSLQVPWSDTLGYADSVFQVVIEADGDIQIVDNTATSTSVYHFEQKLLLENLPAAVKENTGRLRVVAKRTGSPDAAATAAIVIDDPSGLLSAPQTVSFAAGESEKVFYIEVGDNTVYQGDRSIGIRLQATGYLSQSQELTLTDDEIPTLSFEVVATELNEGDYYASFGKVKLDHALDRDLRVKLTYDKNQFANIPDYVVIKAGETEAEFSLSVVDDTVSEIDKTLKLTASADGVGSGSVSLLVKDNDIPSIALSINKSVVAENAGVYALVGTITRTDDTVNYVKVKFTDVNNSNLILPSTVTLGTGAQSVNFYVGIKDNSLVDGDRSATVKASIYIDSCGCTVQPISGETQVSFTIMDDDGEALGLSFDRSNVAENTTGAAKLTVTRNTVNGGALTVHLGVAGTALLELPETVEFAAGQNSVTVTVNTLTDGVNTGNQMAVVTATAEGYAGAVGYLNIADVDLPDFTVTGISPETTPVYAGKQTLVNLTLTNSGFQSYSGAVNVKLTLSDGRSLGTFKVNGSFAVGESRQVGFYVNMPEVTGSRSISAVVDPDNLIPELSDGNNAASSAAFDVKLDYIVMAETVPEVLYGNGVITVSGRTLNAEGAAVGNLPVEVLLKGAYGEKLLTAVSDAEGNYNLSVDTTDMYAGSYSVYAGNLGSYGEAQDKIEIAGLKVEQSKAFVWDIENGTSVNGQFTVSNLSGAALSGVKIRALDAPENFVFTVGDPAELAGNGKLTIDYTVTADGVTAGGGYTLTRGYQKIDFVAESDEEVAATFSGYFYSSPQTGVLTLSENSVSKTLYSGGEYYYEYTVTNTGYGDTGRITVNVPKNQLLTLISNPTIDNLAYGESATITLKVDPTALGSTLALNAAYSGSIGIAAENAANTSLAFDYTFVTNDKGNISITLTDEWTQYAADRPMLAGAKVGVYNAYTNQLVATAYSDENGVVNFTDLAEGKYVLKYSADKHNNAQEVVTVRGGETLNIYTMLQLSTVNYTWNVRKVELSDTYEIVLSTEFETNVPAPVVTIDGPTKIPELAWGESTLLNFTVSNHGLIAAQDFTLELPELGNGYSWRVLNDQPMDIGANSSVNYSVMVQRGDSETSAVQVRKLEYIYDVSGTAVGMKSIKDGITTCYDLNGVVQSQTDGETTYEFFYDDDMNLAYYEEYDLSDACRSRYDINGNIEICSIPGMTFFFTDNAISQIQIDDGNNYNCQYDANGSLTSFDYEESRYFFTWSDGIVTDVNKKKLILIADENIPDSAGGYYDDWAEIQSNVKLYKYNSGGWDEIGEGKSSLDRDKETIVIVHGLSNAYNQAWITDMANACSSTGDYQIVSVYWDEWAKLGGSVSIFREYTSAYIAPVAWQAYNLLCDIKENIKTVIGHSYGAHISGLLSNKLGSVEKLIALDPAEESTIKKQEFRDITGSSEYPYNEWGAASATIVEVYKSSDWLGGGGEGTWLGFDEHGNYGDYNYLLAKSNTYHIRPFSGDNSWNEDGFLGMGSHSLAHQWFIKMIQKNHSIGEWYNQFIDGSSGWDGIINSDTCQLECVTIADTNGESVFINNDNWSGYENHKADWHEAVGEHAKYTDYSVTDVKSYQGVGQQTINTYITIDNLANNTTIQPIADAFLDLVYASITLNPSVIPNTIDYISNLNTLQVYLSSDDTYSSDDELLYGRVFGLSPLSKRVLEVSFSQPTDMESPWLLIYVGVGVGRENLTYELDTTNNFLAVRLDPEIVNCWKKLEGWYVTVCDGVEVNRAEYWVQFGNCPEIPQTGITEYQETSSTYNIPLRTPFGDWGGGGGGNFVSPGIYAENTTCNTYFVSADAAATPDGGLMTYAAVLSDAAGETENICAHVKMEFKQTAVMSREGFEGTLTLSNQAATELTNITFTATVLNSEGADVSDLFEIVDNGTDGFSITQDGTDKLLGLGNNGSGSFTVLYVPGRNTAVDGPEEYQFTGTLSYTDSLVGDVSIDLTPITLTVNPSPALRLHYFVERDVYSDDPDTDAVEAAIPAEISVLVVNAGKGDARNFSLSGFTPSIVDNPKGLLLDYTMTDAALNGVKNDNGIVDVSFGTISANSSAVAQWWYTANIQGHYSDYSVNFEQMDYSYVDLYGNTRYVAASGRADVSLIESADIHELVRSVQCGGDTLPDFLVDDLADVNDTPDTIYLSTGEIEDVNAVTAATVSGAFGTNDVVVTLTAEFAAGWNYLRILDPGNGDYELVGVSRDGEVLNVRNYWQTDRYYVDELGVTYEDRLHLFDHVESDGSATYTLTYTARDKNPLAVKALSGPASVVKSAVDSVTVTFNKEVNADTFTWEDIDLFRQGDLEHDLITSAVTITRTGDASFTIGNLAGVTSADGYYRLVVRTADITDGVGNSGKDGAALTWTMAAAIPAVESVSGIDDLMNGKADEIEVVFAAAVDPATLTEGVFRVNGAAATGLAVSAVGETRTRFAVSGLAALLTEGENSLEIDLSQVVGINGVAGTTAYRRDWTIDLTAPQVAQLSESLGTIGTAPGKLVFEVSEEVTAAPGAFTLKKDGVVVSSDSLNVAVDDNQIVITGIGSVADGVYELDFALNGMTDAAGNTGSGTAVKTWTIDHTAPAQIADFKLAASCDWGESATDGRTACRELTLVGTLPESALTVRIYQQSGGTRTLLRELQPTGTALETTVNVQTGHSVLVAEVTDAVGNSSETTLPVFVDELAFTAEFSEKFEDALTDSPERITLAFSEAVTGLTVNSFKLKSGDTAISLAGATLTQEGDLSYTLSGITGGANGVYTLTVDLGGLVKTSTGLVGSGSNSISWTVSNAEPPTVLSCSIDPSQILDKLETFSIVFSQAMNCAELIESGAITHAVRIAELDGDGNVLRRVELDKNDFQYIDETSTLVWRGADPVAAGGNYRLELAAGLLKNAEGMTLTGGVAAAGIVFPADGGTALPATAESYAVPVWYDFDGDGRMDLLVGEKTADSQGKIRVWLNTGSTKDPAFAEYSYLPGASGAWSIDAANCLGVAFRFADVNGDGANDLVYGTYDGRIGYAINSNGVFSAGTALLADGVAIDVGNRAVFDLADWNGDGYADIVSGAQDGKVHLFVNNGDWTFAAAQTLSIQVANGWSAVAVADIDGDGYADIVSGDAQGGLFCFLNNGDGSFSEVAICSGKVNRSRPFVADVDDDDIVDLTVGYEDGGIYFFRGAVDESVRMNFRINSAPVFSGTPDVAVDGYTVTVSWSAASDDTGVAGYKVLIGDTAYNTADTTLVLTSVAAGTYEYQVGAVDVSGLESWSSRKEFTVADVTSPVLNGTPVAVVWKNQIRISWNAASDNVAVTGYKVEMNGTVYETDKLNYTFSDLSVGDHEYRVAARDAAGAETWSETYFFTVTEVADEADHKLNWLIPTANYGAGCVASSVGMLLGYYDLYGYCGYNVAKLIDGTITVDSRGDNTALLNRFVASDGYYERFVGKTPEEERPYTLTESDLLNTAEWDSLADWLGTGQYWRCGQDLATTYRYGTLNELLTSQETYTVAGVSLPVKYSDFKYGLALYVENLGYELDDELTRTVKANTVSEGTFGFADFAAEIDAGRGVLLSLASVGNQGHMVFAYGYNASTGEIIFDDTLSADNRMVWNGSYTYANHEYAIQSVTTIAFDTAGLYAFAPHTPTDPQGNASGLSWGALDAEQSFVVEYSTDGFEHAVRITVSSNALDSFRLPQGTYQWRVRAIGSDEWVTGENIAADTAAIAPQLVSSDADGSGDVFFVNAAGTWGANYAAKHVGSICDWAGTNESVSISGKNRLVDIFEGSTDANILLMTDDANGDALFVDDIYTALPGTVAEQQARIARIDEIRAGEGNDIVDMTSQRFEYIGACVTVRGGLGNDTIWANKGDNFLFGDSGNDRLVGASGNDMLAGGSGDDSMHGGGGNDIFAFCENWGVDTVEQLADGNVTLWFASGDEANWNAATLTYTDGSNSVTVKGVSADKVTLKFGDDASEQFATLTSIGAFADFTSEKIFEEKGKGILASL